MKEFEIIKNFFSSQKKLSDNVVLGIGDDAAVVNIPEDTQLVTTTDTLICDVHFSKETDPYDIGYKALAVNLSDLAAMGAEPQWATLALSMPKMDEKWIAAFAKGFFELANQFKVTLIGGDTTQGPLSITIQALGLIPTNQILQRKNAKAGDLIFVSNTLGDAGVGLQILKNNIKVDQQYKEIFLKKLNRPQPQINLALKIKNVSQCAIDISDGLVADLKHILEASHVGAVVDVEKLPLSKAMLACIAQKDAINFALGAGDDYELCFTLNETVANQQTKLLKEFNCTCIGKITATHDLQLNYNGKPYSENLHGYEHFS